MRRFRMLILPMCVLFLVGCKSEPEKATADVEHTVPTEEPETIQEVEEITAGPSTFLFKSDDMGTGEYLKLIEAQNGDRTWYYYSEKRPEEVKLGRKLEKGFENIYFTSSPKVLYTIGGSECGFHLSDNEKGTSQWYDQIEPSCPN